MVATSDAGVVAMESRASVVTTLATSAVPVSPGPPGVPPGGPGGGVAPRAGEAGEPTPSPCVGLASPASALVRGKQPHNKINI